MLLPSPSKQLKHTGITGTLRRTEVWTGCGTCAEAGIDPVTNEKCAICDGKGSTPTRRVIEQRCHCRGVIMQKNPDNGRWEHCKDCQYGWATLVVIHDLTNNSPAYEEVLLP